MTSGRIVQFYFRALRMAGNNWMTQESGIVGLESLWSVDFLDSRRGSAVGYAALVLRTDDGGKTWQQLEAFPEAHWITDVQMLDDTTIWIVGEEMLERSGSIIYTDDGGLTWTDQSLPVSNGCYSVKFIDQYTGWVVGASGLIVHTTTGGIP